VIDAVVVLQARMASTRLPGKVLVPLGAHTLLAHCVRRLQAAAVGPVIVATTLRPDDDEVAAEAERLKCRVVRGPTDDVLARFMMASVACPSRWVIRATADNPALDIGSPERLLRAVVERDADYGVEEGHPFGAAVELVSADTLHRVAAVAIEPYDREHVTPYVYRHPDQFRIVRIAVPAELRRPDIRLTVDTPADLAFMRRVLDRADAGDGPAPLLAVIAAADAVRREMSGEST